MGWGKPKCAEQMRGELGMGWGSQNVVRQVGSELGMAKMYGANERQVRNGPDKDGQVRNGPVEVRQGRNGLGQAKMCGANGR